MYGTQFVCLKHGSTDPHVLVTARTETEAMRETSDEQTRRYHTLLIPLQTPSLTQPNPASLTNLPMAVLLGLALYPPASKLKAFSPLPISIVFLIVVSSKEFLIFLVHWSRLHITHLYLSIPTCPPVIHIPSHSHAFWSGLLTPGSEPGPRRLRFSVPDFSPVRTRALPFQKKSASSGAGCPAVLIRG